LGDAAAYSRLSLSHPVLHEIGFDDFVGQAQRQRRSLPELSKAMSGITRALKSSNPNLRFGITLYMDELQSSRFRLANLGEDFRTQVDFVHLYPHYRREAETFEASLKRVRTIFPSAEVIAGVYAYDRRDYLPCARGDRTPCSNQEEIHFFEQEVRERQAMVQNGRIRSIEFYPGDFGLEERWTGWDRARNCQSGRKDECIANTKTMRALARNLFKQ
jgi:hypothetical protein